MSNSTGLKRIEAILNPERLDEVKIALESVGVFGMTVTEVKGLGRPREKAEVFKTAAPATEYLGHVKIDVVVPDELVSDAVATIGKTARTGAIGDGKIFVSTVEEVIRIAGGERGRDAL